MGKKPDAFLTTPAAVDISDYCHQIEVYLCQKNDGHLIRVVGPSFDLVSRWAADGVPLRVAQSGIDRYFERYYRKGPRRRPVRIDFCEADVRDLFDEWRRATGVVTTSASRATDDPAEPAEPRKASLRDHLARVILRLTSGRANGVLGTDFDPLIDRLSHELDGVRRSPQGLRGAARQAVLDRLAAADGELMAMAQAMLDAAARAAVIAQANEELETFRAHMPADAFARAQHAIVERLVRDRFSLPTITL